MLVLSSQNLAIFAIWGTITTSNTWIASCATSATAPATTTSIGIGDIDEASHDQRKQGRFRNENRNNSGVRGYPYSREHSHRHHDLDNKGHRAHFTDHFHEHNDFDARHPPRHPPRNPFHSHHEEEDFDVGGHPQHHSSREQFDDSSSSTSTDSQDNLSSTTTAGSYYRLDSGDFLPPFDKENYMDGEKYQLEDALDYEGATLVDLCQLESNKGFEGYEFADNGVIMTPLKPKQWLFAESTSGSDCWCVGSCRNKDRESGPYACDFEGGIVLEFIDNPEFVSVQILNPFADVMFSFYGADGLIYEDKIGKGSSTPSFGIASAKSVAKIVITGNGPWCMHESIRLTKQHSPKYPNYQPPNNPGIPNFPSSSHHNPGIYLPIAIKPRLCPNNLWTKTGQKSYGKVFPVAIFGTNDFDVTWVDFDSIYLEGYSGSYPVKPVKYLLKDISSPNYNRGDVCDCTYAIPDGYIDMMLHFDKNDVIHIPEVAAAGQGEPVKLILRGIAKAPHTFDYNNRIYNGGGVGNGFGTSFGDSGGGTLFGDNGGDDGFQFDDAIFDYYDNNGGYYYNFKRENKKETVNTDVNLQKKEKKGESQNEVNYQNEKSEVSDKEKRYGYNNDGFRFEDEGGGYYYDFVNNGNTRHGGIPFYGEDCIIAILNGGGGGGPLLDPGPRYIPISIKPRLCPNNLWTKTGKKSYDKIFPVAIIGTPDFDVSWVDFNSIYIQGISGSYPVKPILYSIKDITSPYYGKVNVCDCDYNVPDGIPDMILKFNKGQIMHIPEVAAAGPGEAVVLKIGGLAKFPSTYVPYDVSGYQSNAGYYNGGVSTNGDFNGRAGNNDDYYDEDYYGNYKTDEEKDAKEGNDKEAKFDNGADKSSESENVGLKVQTNSTIKDSSNFDFNDRRHLIPTTPKNLKESIGDDYYSYYNDNYQNEGGAGGGGGDYQNQHGLEVFYGEDCIIAVVGHHI